MPDMKKWEAFWEGLSVAERIKHIENRPISPSLKEMSDNFEKKRREGRLPKYDLVPSFISSFKAMEESSKVGSAEERGLSRACMSVLRKSARQQLGKRDFARFKEGIK